MSDRPSKRVVTWDDAQQKAAWLDAAASIDAQNSKVRDLAIRFAKASGPNRPEAYARECFEFVRDAITYVPDPNHVEEFADAATVIERGADDCDGKARTFVALVRAAPVGGIEARILPIFRHSGGLFTPDPFVHVQAQARWPGTDKDARHERGGWLRAELTIAGVELGDDPEKAPRGPDGRRIYT